MGRFAARDGGAYPRGARVVCRTERGLEVGQVLARLADESVPAQGSLLRRVTAADDLLLARLEKNRDSAYHACTALLRRRGLQAVLMDVEHLLDGQSLYFYFLGEVTPELEQITAELAETYETKVQFRRFAETLATGCGPDCGTEAAAGGGCASSGCASCAVSCRTKLHRS